MDVRNCKTCGKIFNYIGGQPICPTCKRNLEDKFQEVKAYIKDNPEAQIYQVAEDTDVNINQLRQWIREERLTFSDSSTIGIECEKCGITIKTGRFCNRCKEDIAHNLGSAYGTQKKEEVNEFKNKDTTSKMRYLNRDR
ncbi:flagellar operon protein (TIGR03826 family) [Natranaerovirga pectinivora]|uniref:Flagellar operon protein (TIGR03826 family) n=1 Tax=Natranaerovirga pectinivora TaxID=682400 RepID=A0A4V2V048_9FIRM|nr:flagellar protein [Natranaerovirga pectinivora]TCT14011.1 flagellar operon protein (TIGR03826 family) [Natranaerovirga pectinivora]